MADPLSAPALSERIEADLRDLNDPVRAVFEKRYLKSDLEHGGVTVPRVRSVVRTAVRNHPDLTRDDVLALVAILWASGRFESRLAATLLLDAHVAGLTALDVDLLQALIRDGRTWALVDELAGSVAGRLLLRLPEVEAAYRRWAADEHQWVRRAGVLSFLAAVRDEARFDRYFPVLTEIADPILEDRRFFVRKAIGWVLREAAKRHPDEVFAWLAPRVSRASGVTRREAARHMSPEQRNQLLERRHG